MIEKEITTTTPSTDSPELPAKLGLTPEQIEWLKELRSRNRRAAQLKNEAIAIHSKNRKANRKKSKASRKQRKVK
jgi:hypothetical protein